MHRQFQLIFRAVTELLMLYTIHSKVIVVCGLINFLRPEGIEELHKKD